ncbi:ABC transporter permease [Ruminococcus flavefaciens]|uniref:ABC transporter permease n=1 Tax=Ruminococcus flavefaciens TaxID=1265 RepID=UPI0026F200F7|nr:ABC transporter permease [Ruminococcus flavefaciens]
MRLVFKHLFKNIWAHKLRTVLLILIIAVCSFTAMISFDMSGSLNGMIKGVLSNTLGTSDIEVETKSPVDDSFGEGAPDCNIIKMAVMGSAFDRHIDFDSSYVNRSMISVFGFDEDTAKKMSLIREGTDLSGKKAAISESFADEFGYKVGDKIVFHGEQDKPVEFTVGSIEKKQGIFNMGEIAVISYENMKELTLSGELEITDVLIDVKDDARVAEAEKFFKKKYPTAEVTNFLESKEVTDAIKSVTRLFVVLFAVCLLLVIFVTISVSERMIVDKMSVVGTFRSLGISAKKTTFALMFENALYGLVGSIIGIIAYCLIKKPFFDSAFVIGGTDAIKPPVPMPKWYLIAAVIIGAMLIECLCPIKEAIKAIKTPIRDIIFNTKETEYRPSRVFTVIGIILLAVSVVTFFFKDSFVLSMTCFVCFIASVAMLFNYVERGIAGLLAKLFAKRNFPIAHLAAVEAGNKKSTVGSSVLCVTAAALAIVIYIFSNSLASMYDHAAFNCDVICTLSGCKSDLLSYVEQLDGVDKVEYFYLTVDDLKLDNEKVDCYVYGFNNEGAELLSAFDLDADHLEKDEVCLDRMLMKKYGYKEGDKVKITFMDKGYLPIVREFTIKAKVKIDYMAATGTSVIVSEEVYKEIYNDFPQFMLVRGDDAKALKKTIQDHSGDFIQIAYTKSEYDLNIALTRAAIKMILNILILIGVGLTFAGVVSNQLIGLEGRKRECAVMTSVAMPRKKLSKMFLIENMISSGTALLFAVPVGIFMSYEFGRIMDILEQVMPVRIPVIKCIFYAIFLFAVFTLVSLFPIRALKKMDVVSQLKYE